ncbi:hypothetical protein ACLM2U_10245 [Bacillus pumilus]
MKKTLQALFDQPIVSVETLGEQYDGRANDVRLISLQDKTEYVVKSPKMTRAERVNAHRGQEHLDQINEKLALTNSFHIPKVVRKVKMAKLFRSSILGRKKIFERIPSHFKKGCPQTCKPLLCRSA